MIGGYDHTEGSQLDMSVVARYDYFLSLGKVKSC